jgi:hypothetical protein
MKQAFGLHSEIWTMNPGRLPWAGMKQAFGLKGRAKTLVNNSYQKAFVRRENSWADMSDAVGVGNALANRLSVSKDFLLRPPGRALSNSG